MMREDGKRFVCDRCKRELFIPGKDTPVNFVRPDDWGFHIDVDSTPYKEQDLCPDCYSTYQIMIADFMALRDIKVVE